MASSWNNCRISRREFLLGLLSEPSLEQGKVLPDSVGISLFSSIPSDGNELECWESRKDEDYPNAKEADFSASSSPQLEASMDERERFISLLVPETEADFFNDVPKSTFSDICNKLSVSHASNDTEKIPCTDVHEITALVPNEAQESVLNSNMSEHSPVEVSGQVFVNGNGHQGNLIEIGMDLSEEDQNDVLMVVTATKLKQTEDCQTSTDTGPVAEIEESENMLVSFANDSSISKLSENNKNLLSGKVVEYRKIEELTFSLPNGKYIYENNNNHKNVNILATLLECNEKAVSSLSDISSDDVSDPDVEHDSLEEDDEDLFKEKAALKNCIRIGDLEGFDDSTSCSGCAEINEIDNLLTNTTTFNILSNQTLDNYENVDYGAERARLQRIPSIVIDNYEDSVEITDDSAVVIEDNLFSESDKSIALNHSAVCVSTYTNAGNEILSINVNGITKEFDYKNNTDSGEELDLLNDTNCLTPPAEVIAEPHVAVIGLVNLQESEPIAAENMECKSAVIIVGSVNSRSEEEEKPNDAVPSLELERRKLIASQAQRLRRIESWVDSSSGEEDPQRKLERLRSQDSVTSPSEPETPVSYPMESMRKYNERRLMKRQHAVDVSKPIQNPEQASNKVTAKGEVDSSSILDSKDTTKNFWKKKMIENPPENVPVDEGQIKRPQTLDLTSTSWDADSENSVLSPDPLREDVNSPTPHINKSPEVSVSLMSNNSGDSAFHDENSENASECAEVSDVSKMNENHSEDELADQKDLHEAYNGLNENSEDNIQQEEKQEDNDAEEEEEGVDFEEFQIDTRPPRFEKYDYNPREEIRTVVLPKVEINRGLIEEPPLTPEADAEEDLSYETIIDKEIRLQQDKEDRLAMERTQAQQAAQHKVEPVKNTMVNNSTVKVQEKKNVKNNNVMENIVRPIYRQISKDRVDANPTEVRIAMEIQEFKMREQELRDHRERFGSMENLLDGKDGDSHSEASSVDSGKVNGHVSPSAEVLEGSICLTPDHRTTSLDSVSSGYSSTAEMNNKKDRKVSVKPFLDEIEDNKPSYRLTKESAVEREIRLSLDREEQLRKERGLPPLQLEQQPKMNKERSTPVNNTPVNGERNNVVSEAKKELNSIVSNGRTQNCVNNKQIVEKKHTQRRIATTRIQQEIEEQIQREQALRELGVIKTTSEDHLDSRVARFGESDLIPSNTFGERINNGKHSSLERQNSSDSVLSASSVSSHKPLSVSVSNGNHRPYAPSQSNSSVRPFIRSGGTSPITPVSPVGSSSRVVSPFRKNSAPSGPVGRPGVMEKFINSRGKMSMVPAFNAPTYDHQPEVQLNQDIVQSVRTVLDAPQSKPTVPAAPTYKKNSYRTESKIQAELKEMRAREEELRLIRSKTFGRSQPNLLAIDDDDDTLQTNGHQQNGLSREKSSSNPNLLDDSDYTDHTNLHKKLGKRSSTLIQQWEQLIKSNE